MDVIKDDQHEAEESPVTETTPSPKEVSKKVISIEVATFDNGTQTMDVKTPIGSTITDSLGLLEMAKHILIKDKF